MNIINYFGTIIATIGKKDGNNDWYLWSLGDEYCLSCEDLKQIRRKLKELNNA